MIWAAGSSSRPFSMGATMAADLVFSYLHFVLAFALVALLAIELVLVQRGLDAAGVRKLGRIDAFYGVTAGLLLAAGFARVYFGLKSPEFYWSSPAFHLKLTVFVLLGLASLPPTIRYIQWSRGLKSGARTAVADSEIAAVRRWLHLEAGLLLLLPLAAGLMARGIWS
jgi:putative membrane protein